MNKIPCPHCGNNQTNHALAWFDQSMMISLTGVNKTISRWWLTKLLARGLDLSGPYILSLLVFVGLAKWNTDISKAVSRRGYVLWEEANKRGIKMKSAVIIGRHLDLYTATKGKKTISFMSIPTGDGQEKESIWWLDDKALLKKKLEPQNVPVSRGGQFTSWRKAKKRFAEIDKPVIVKPRVGSRGRHTTTSIHTEAELKEAFYIAKQLCHYVIMEEHLIGSVYRGTTVDGKVVGILRGDPPRITGDGTHTISQLVEMQNNNRSEHISAITLTHSHKEFLLRNGHTPETVLPQGVTIDLLEKIGTSYGGSSKEMLSETHPKIIAYLERASAVVNYPVIGFDFIITDPTIDPDTQKWGIIEANSAPFINLHHDPVEGTPVNVASAVWDLIEKKKFNHA